MSGKLIVISSDDRIKNVDYTDYTSIQNGVGGMMERFAGLKFPAIKEISGNDEIYCDLYCNEEFYYAEGDAYDKVNAVAMLLTGHEHIRGNVVLIPADPEEGSNRGFDYAEIEDDGEVIEDICECWVMEDMLLKYIHDNKDALKQIHKAQDKNKSMPEWEIERI